ncbi:hypothetical protein [Arthrobacter sp. D5-1]|uniref:hypothetical protein n=1 Tax=Arthrobacter sp. D5-1 TaxID=1477518 RepID=UPI001A9973C1|nr:hypothetical protein [Arthrobacter sp. D5-1]QSZ49426.1 hypothetical protein AYX22_14135 [Arthrobacter sp. D5-1]
MDSETDLRERIKRREREVQHFTREAIKFGTSRDLFAWEAKFLGDPQEVWDIVHSLSAKLREMWEHISTVSEQLATDQDTLRRLTRPPLRARLKQLF